MSQLGVFINLEQDTILRIKQNAVEVIMGVKTIMDVTGQGTEATQVFAMKPIDIIEECDFALRSNWPHEYHHFRYQIKPFFV